MKLSPQWLRDFVDLKVDNATLAHDLTSIGIAVEGISGSGADAVFEMEIGTNRPDAMNHYGVAREAAAFYNLPLKPIETKLPKPSGIAGVTITIEDSRYCPRFTARVLQHVKVKPSPEPIAHRLQLLDQRPISNAVDATNYVLWEIGKPTHVYDLDLLEGRRLIIRFARAGETLKTLDGVERKLTTEDLVVADAKKPVGLAGVMGGFDTMITEKTTNILIESAWWDPATVRAMSKRYSLHTDASHRFERGADFESTVLSTDRVAELILASGGGQLVGDMLDVVVGRRDLAPIALQIPEVHRILGNHVGTPEMLGILTRLGFEYSAEREDGTEYTLTIPSWRLDVEREIDVIEEIARVYGYDKFPNTLPSFAGGVIELPDAAKDATVRSSLLALGYNEAVSLTFISKDDAQQFSAMPALELANPLSAEASMMRTSLAPGMLDMLAWNLNRGTGNVRLFEYGHVCEGSAPNPNDKSGEPRRLCFAQTGKALAHNVNLPQESRPLTFFDLKGDVEDLARAFEFSAAVYDSQAPSYYHPGRSARVVLDGTPVGHFGQLHPDVAAARKLKQEIWLAEFDVDALYQLGLRQPRYLALPRYPAVERDFSFTVADGISFENLQQVVDHLKIADLRRFEPVEIFRGGNVPAGRYSILLRATFQSNERTLREEEVAQWSAQIIQGIERLGGALRSQ
jgi:phenylalanyl-tRNA synthetase beta chain